MKAWAHRWNIPPEAIRELFEIMAHIELAPSATVADGNTEAPCQAGLRVLAPYHKGHLWRNNRGATKTESGGMVRFGIGNDSSKVDKVIKSSDLIGFTSIEGVAVFTAVEVKKPGWKAPTNERERAQAAFLKLIHAGGGIATFATQPSDYLTAITRWKNQWQT